MTASHNLLRYLLKRRLQNVKRVYRKEINANMKIYRQTIRRMKERHWIMAGKDEGGLYLELQEKRIPYLIKKFGDGDADTDEHT